MSKTENNSSLKKLVPTAAAVIILGFFLGTVWRVFIDLPPQAAPEGSHGWGTYLKEEFAEEYFMKKASAIEGYPHFEELEPLRVLLVRTRGEADQGSIHETNEKFFAATFAYGKSLWLVPHVPNAYDLKLQLRTSFWRSLRKALGLD